MLGSTVLETAIGLVLVFLLVSLICSALREAIESIMKHRALDLYRGMRELLQDEDGKGLAREVYSHPLVYGLFKGKYELIELNSFNNWLRPVQRLPSYIPSGNFARALLDLEQQGRIQSPEIVAVIRSLAQDTGNDVARLRANVEEWFNASSERISGWYKRRTQLVLFILGFGAATVLNVNPIVIGDTLFHESDLRAAAVATAETYASADRESKQAYQTNLKELHNLANAGMPIGNHPSALEASAFTMLLGWLITGLAVTLGANFWFDLLSKFMTVRSTIKPKQSKPEKEAEAVVPVTTVGAPAARAEPVTVAADVVRASRAAIPLPLVAAGFEKHEWSDGNEEGLL